MKIKHLSLLLAGLLTSAWSTHAASYYVATDGSDSNDGLSLITPFRTIQKALNTVSAGDTVYIRDGIYREGATVIPGHTGDENNLITVQPYQDESVVIKASVEVTDWDVHDLANGIWKKTNWLVNSQQVFVHTNQVIGVNDEGLLLRQIGMPNNLLEASSNGKDTYFFTVGYHFNDEPLGMGPNTVTNLSYWPEYFDTNQSLQGTNFYIPEIDATNFMASNPGTFYYASNSSTLYVRLPDDADPNDRGMEASVYWAPLLPGWGMTNAYFHFKNLNLRHGNATAWSGYFASGVGGYSIYDSCDIQWADFAGLMLHEGSIATNCIISNNGNKGGGASHNTLYTHCTITSNNYRGYSGRFCHGGLKVGFNYAVTVEHCEIAYNTNSSGIWVDSYRTNQTVHIRNNYVHNNGGAGIYSEISQNVSILNNVVVSNMYCGIVLTGSDNCVVANNSVIATQTDGIEWTAAIQVNLDSRATCSSNRILNNIVYATEARYDLLTPTNSIEFFDNTIDFNCFYRTNEEPFFCHQSGGIGDKSFAQWKADTGFDSNSVSIDPVFSVGIGTDYALANSSPLIDRGTSVTEVTDDYIGTARPLQRTHDIGAFENTGHKKGDFDLDGNIDVLWRNQNPLIGSNLIWQMNATNILATNCFLPTLATNWQIRATPDLDGDGKTDILWRQAGNTNTTVWFMDGTNFVSSTFLPIGAGTNWTLAASADINNDGWADILWRDYNDGRNAVWYMQGTNRLSAAFLDTAGIHWVLAAAADFDGDAKPDLLWRDNDGTGQQPIAMWHMDGTNRIDSVLLSFTPDVNWVVGGVEDYDQDGKQDILWWRRDTGASVLWFMNDTNRLGTLSLPTEPDLSWKIVGPR